MSPRTGRRPDGEDTRRTILDAARELFAANGYDRTSLRGVARAAGVDPALVHHYFDGKPGLFTAALELPLDPEQAVPLIVEGPREELGERVARLYLQVWEGPGAGHMIALLRSALTHDQAARMLREFITATLLTGVADSLDVDQPRLRASLVGAHVVGLGVLRGVLGFAPLVDATGEELVAWLAPTIQRYLTGPSPGTAAPHRQ